MSSPTHSVIEFSWHCQPDGGLLLDVTKAVILDHIMAILYVGWHSLGEGLTEEEAQACIKHFSPYVKWRGAAVEWEFQALTLAEGQEEIRAHEAQSQKTL